MDSHPDNKDENIFKLIIIIKERIVVLCEHITKDLA
jgi:hypothetical protein